MNNLEKKSMALIVLPNNVTTAANSGRPCETKTFYGVESMKKTLLVVATAVGISGAVQAAPITVGGVTWDPDNAVFDLSAQASIFEYDVNAIGDTLQFWGRVNEVNGQPVSSFCQSGGCAEVTIYGEYTVTNVGDFNTDGLVDIVFDNGFANVYSDTALNFNSLNPTTAQDGILWLALTGVDWVKFGQSGELHATLTSGAFDTPGDTGLGSGYFDVVGGVAAPYFLADTITAPDGTVADVSFSQSFQPTNDSTILFGTAEIKSDTTAIPAPGTLALLGLAGLLIPVMRKRA